MATGSNKAINNVASVNVNNKQYPQSSQQFGDTPETFAEITNQFNVPLSTNNKAINNVASGNVNNKSIDG